MTRIHGYYVIFSDDKDSNFSGADVPAADIFLSLLCESNI